MKRKHGLSKTKLYYVWRGMLDRCKKPICKSYKNYGGRGISVCNKWNDFMIFKDWADHNGFNETLQIDRINNDGNYEPNNCRFVTRSENQINRRHRDSVCIQKRNNCSTYRVSITRRPNTYSFPAKTYEDAVEIRDNFLKQEKLNK